MKELLDYFEKYGYHSEECPNYKPKMKSLKLAIKLGEKLLKDEYNKFYKLHYQKWGEIELKTVKTDNPIFYELVPYRNGDPIEQGEREIQELRDAMLKDDRIKQKHRLWFYNILAKYGEYWWD